MDPSWLVFCTPGLWAGGHNLWRGRHRAWWPAGCDGPVSGGASSVQAARVTYGVPELRVPGSSSSAATHVTPSVSVAGGLVDDAAVADLSATTTLRRDVRARGGLALVVLARRELARPNLVGSRRPAAHRVVCGAATLMVAGPSRRPASSMSSGLTST